jgi:hypothetical protein
MCGTLFPLFMHFPLFKHNGECMVLKHGEGDGGEWVATLKGGGAGSGLCGL